MRRSSSKQNRCSNVCRDAFSSLENLLFALIAEPKYGTQKMTKCKKYENKSHWTSQFLSSLAGLLLELIQWELLLRQMENSSTQLQQIESPAQWVRKNSEHFTLTIVLLLSHRNWSESCRYWTDPTRADCAATATETMECCRRYSMLIG